MSDRTWGARKEGQGRNPQRQEKVPEVRKAEQACLPSCCLELRRPPFPARYQPLQALSGLAPTALWFPLPALAHSLEIPAPLSKRTRWAGLGVPLRQMPQQPLLPHHQPVKSGTEDHRVRPMRHPTSPHLLGCCLPGPSTREDSL